MYKALVIGCGKIAGFYDSDKSAKSYSHSQAYFQNNDIEIICYVDIDLQKAISLAKKYDCPNYSDNFIKSIQQYHPEIISVCTPDGSHYDITKQIIEIDYRPKIIFLEKPVCKKHEELLELQAMADTNNIVIIPNHSRRFDLRNKYLKQMIQKNRFGKLVRGDIFYYGGWMHNGIHVIDLLYFLFDAQIFLKDVKNPIKTQYDDDPTLDVCLKLNDYPAFIHLHGFDEKYYQIFDIDLKFEFARIKIEDFGSRLIFEEKSINNMCENILVPALFNIKFPKITAIDNAVKMIVDYLKTGNKEKLNGYTIVDVADTMETIWKGHNAYKIE